MIRRGIREIVTRAQIALNSGELDPYDLAPIGEQSQQLTPVQDPNEPSAETTPSKKSKSAPLAGAATPSNEAQISDIIESFTRKTSQMYFELFQARVERDEAKGQLKQQTETHTREVAQFKAQIQTLEKQLAIAMYRLDRAIADHRTSAVLNLRNQIDSAK